MRRVSRSSFSIRTLKIIFTLFIFILLSFIINNYYKKGKKNIKINQNNSSSLRKQNIFPIYKNSILSLPMSQTGDPFVYVFLTKDGYEKVVDFYKETLKGTYTLNKIVYKKMMTIYQFRSIEDDKKKEIEKKLKMRGNKNIKILNDYIKRGIEIIPLNHLWEKVLEAKTKIKIIVPREIVFKNKNKNKNKI
jgi:hypothetical protein